MRSEDSVLQGTVVAQCLHSMWTICQALFLSLHIHMAPPISMADGPLRCDVMVSDTFIVATEDAIPHPYLCVMRQIFWEHQMEISIKSDKFQRAGQL